MSNINLIPETEIEQQQKTRAIKTSSIFSIFILVLILGVSGYFFITTSNIKKEMTRLDSEISSLRTQIRSMDQVEIIARNLDSKYRALKSVFQTRVKYSKLLEEIRYRQPDELIIENMDIKLGRINVSGIADSYISIANFVNALVDDNFEGGTDGLESVFTSVSLNSVNLEGASSKVKFFIIIEFNSDLLR